VSAPSPATGPPITDSAALAADLLTAADLPVGYASLDLPTDPAATAGDADVDRASTDPADCAQVLAPITTQVPGALAQASAHYGGPGFAGIDVDAASYPADRTGAAFDSVQQRLGRCTTYDGTDADGYAVEYRVADLPMPGVGDASRAVRVTTTSEGLTLISDVVIAVAGSTLFQLAATQQIPIDGATLAELAQAQADRLRSADR
jgi:hypothetical protein